MGLVGAGFVGPHHIDAVRRLGFVDVVALADIERSSGSRQGGRRSACRRATAGTRSCSTTVMLHVVHVATPNHLHSPIVTAAIAQRQARRVRQAARDDQRRGKRRSSTQATRAGIVHAVTFNYRGNPLVQQARAGHCSWRHRQAAFRPRTLPAGLAPRGRPTIPGGSSSTEGGAASALGDIGSHWCDLAEHVSGLRIVAGARPT